jgi:hypothetical protein
MSPNSKADLEEIVCHVIGDCSYLTTANLMPRCVKPNVADPFRGKTRKSASDVAAHRLGQVEAYLTVREVLSEASTAADGVLSRERSGF